MELTLRRGLLRREIDLLHGPIFKNLLLFALPIFISQLFQQLYNTVDTMIVGNVLGDTSLAAIGACGSIYELLVGFGLGIGNGLAIVTARGFGAGDRERVKKSVAGSIVIGVLSSLAITLAGSLAMRPLLRALNTPPEILEEAYSYISVITLFILVMFAYNLCAGLLRAIGNCIAPLAFLVLSACLNIALDLTFIIRLGMGVRGAAVATVLSQGMSVLLCILYIAKRTEILLPRREHFVPDGALYRELLGQGFSMGFMSSIVSAGSVILQYGINGLGTLVIAGHTAGRKLYVFTAMPFSALAMAVSTFVSQNRGADQPARICKGLRQACLFDIAGAALISVLMPFIAPGMVKAVSGSSEAVVLYNGALYLMVTAPFYAVLGALLATRYALQGLGQKLLPLVSSCIELVGKVLFVLVFIPRFAYMAVVFCEPVIWCVMTAQLLFSFYTDPYIRAVKKRP